VEDPIHQFEIINYFYLGHVAGHEIAFTNSALYMIVGVAAIALVFVGSTARPALVPDRWQSVAEISYEFVANMVEGITGSDGLKFVPLVFTLFMFILFTNVIGLIPYAFAITSQIIVTAALAGLVFVVVIVYGVVRHGMHFFDMFIPRGVPLYILPMIVCIEIISFLSRPLSHSVRLFANILGGHITLKVFAGFISMLGGLGFIGWIGAIIPFGMVVALTALEVLVAFLQAYVFAVLTCIYLNDAIHPRH
jgi:F-type H+-transporting ATPase subunit a